MNYKAEKLSEHIIRIIDMTGVSCYLIIGETKACLLDTCNGFGDIKEFVETLTDRPIFVILTHGHHDHMGGAALFDEVYMNALDMPVFHKFGDMQSRIKDARNLNVPEEILVPTRETEIENIQNHQVFDLGNLHIEMIHVPGHTPGMMCPLIQEERTIIFGDACGVSVLLFDEFSSTISQYLESLTYLKQYEEYYDTIYRNHGTFVSPKDLLDNVIECCQLILDHKDDHVPVSMHGYNLFAAKKTNHFRRVDGKEGNILYALDKVR